MESLLPPESARVLLAEPSLPYRRVIREALQSFRKCVVDDAPSAERAFELALQRHYHLYIFAFSLPDLSGLLLDRLLSRASPLVHKGTHSAPPVVFLTRPEDAPAFQTAQRDARHRGHLPYPPKLDALLTLTSGLLPAHACPALPQI